MKWEVIFQPDNLALYGEGILTTLALLFSSLAIGPGAPPCCARWWALTPMWCAARPC